PVDALKINDRAVCGRMGAATRRHGVRLHFLSAWVFPEITVKSGTLSLTPCQSQDISVAKPKNFLHHGLNKKIRRWPVVHWREGPATRKPTERGLAMSKDYTIIEEFSPAPRERLMTLEAAWQMLGISRARLY